MVEVLENRRLLAATNVPAGYVQLAADVSFDSVKPGHQALYASIKSGEEYYLFSERHVKISHPTERRSNTMYFDAVGEASEFSQKVLSANGRYSRKRTAMWLYRWTTLPRGSSVTVSPFAASTPQLPFPK